MGLPGNTTLQQGGTGLSVIAVPETISYKAGGITIDWSTVPSIGQNEILTLTIDATGGTFTLTFGGQTTGAIAENATAATVEEALEGLSTIGNGNVQVSGSAGGPYTIEFVEDLRRTNVGALTTNAASLTGGAGTATVAVVQQGAAEADTTLADGQVVKANDKYIRWGTVMTKITASGKYGPYDSGASDGRQTLTRGQCFIVPHTLVQSDQGSGGTGFAIEGGQVYEARLLMDTGTAPTKTNLLAAFPDLKLVNI